MANVMEGCAFSFTVLCILIIYFRFLKPKPSGGELLHSVAAYKFKPLPQAKVRTIRNQL